MQFVLGLLFGKRRFILEKKKLTVAVYKPLHESQFHSMSIIIASAQKATTVSRLS